MGEALSTCGLHAAFPMGKEEVLELYGHLMDFRPRCMQVKRNQNRQTLQRFFFPLNLQNLPTIHTKNEKKKK